jgi:hypothetical protein
MGARETGLLISAADLAIISEALSNCEMYFDDKADADCDQDGFIPNEEMTRLSEVERALAAIKNITVKQEVQS